MTKQFDRDTAQRSLLFQVDYPEIEEGGKPRHRFMSAYEQKVETWDKQYQYLLVAAEPYEVIAFKVPNMEIDKSRERFFTHWEPDKKVFTLQLHFKSGERAAGPGGGTGVRGRLRRGACRRHRRRGVTGEVRTSPGRLRHAAAPAPARRVTASF